MKEKGLPYENLDAIKNQGLSVSGMSKKINDLNEKNRVIGSHPNFAQFLKEAYEGAPAKQEIPERLKQMPTEQIESLKGVFSHFMTPMFSDFKKEIEMLVREEMLGVKLPDFEKHEKELSDFLKERGITNPTDATLTWAYGEIKKQLEDEPNGDSPDSETPKPKKNLRQIGITPKSVDRKGRKPATTDLKTDKDWEEEFNRREEEKE